MRAPGRRLYFLKNREHSFNHNAGTVLSFLPCQPGSCGPNFRHNCSDIVSAGKWGWHLPSASLWKVLPQNIFTELLQLPTYYYSSITE